MNRGHWRTLSSWLLAAAGIGILAALAMRVSWSTIAATLREAAIPWLGASLVLAIASVSLRAFRLSVLLGWRGTFPQIWRSVCLGYFGSLFLPLGGGEIVKVAALQRQAGLSLPRAGAALTMDRLFDIATLFTLLVSLLGHGLIQGVRAGPMLMFAITMAALIALLLFLLLSGDVLRSRILVWAEHHPGRHAWVHRFDEIHDQANALRRPFLLPTLGALQACIFTMDILAAWCGLLAFPFGHGLPASAPLRLALFAMIGFGLPLLPGGLGSHQAATILALAPYGIGAAQALAVSLAGEATHVAALAGLGLVAIAGSGLNPLRLTRHREVLDSPHPPEIS
ncbi:MAG TPA: lysylphosphatidylglycerol synthase transmembrane domain-containing protein [Geothrix sp.]|jgi:hypothetical protein